VARAVEHDDARSAGRDRRPRQHEKRSEYDRDTRGYAIRRPSCIHVAD
jgi:hypothetical protein